MCTNLFGGNYETLCAKRTLYNCHLSSHYVHLYHLNVKLTLFIISIEKFTIEKIGAKIPNKSVYFLVNSLFPE